MKKLSLILLLFSHIAFANGFNELSENELLPANDGYYGCYIYDDHKIISSMNKNGLFIDNQFFKLTSKQDLFELGENKGKTAIYTYQKINLKPKNYQLLVECGRKLA